jgi:hypothetical protein
MTRLLENLATTHATLAPKLSQANTVLEDLVKAVIDRLTPDTPAL